MSVVVLVHGVPEDASLWDELRAQLGDRDTVALNLPGFGTELPDGFEPTKEGYLAWLEEQVSAHSEPVDLVGHDWGGILAVRLALTRPKLVRTWVTDAVAIYDPQARWHDLALLWQTPGKGEEFMETLQGQTPEQRAGLLSSSGMPEGYAGHAAEIMGRVMADCILTLYRSATDVHGDWGDDVEGTERPALAIDATADPFRTAGRTRAAAERLGLAVEVLEGAGHWWPLEDPAAAAGMLRRFWSAHD